MSEPTAAERTLAAKLQLDPAALATARDALNAIALLPWSPAERVALLTGVVQSGGADVGAVFSRLALEAAPLASFEGLLSVQALGMDQTASVARALSAFDVAPLVADTRSLADARAALAAAQEDNVALRAEIDTLRAREAGRTVVSGDRPPSVMRISDVATSVGHQVALVDHVLRSGPNGIRLHGVDLRLNGTGTALDGDVALDLGPQSGGSALAIAFVPSAEGLSGTADSHVPDVRGYTATLAQRKLAARGFGATVISVAGSSGVVADQSPFPGAVAHTGSVIRLIVRDAEPAVATPTFNPGPGRFTAPLSVVLATPTPAATIRYTTDETEPTAGNGFTYTAPVTITGTATLKARAFRSGFRESAVASAAYIRVVPSMTVGLHSRIGVDTLLGGIIELRRDEDA